MPSRLSRTGALPHPSVLSAVTYVCVCFSFRFVMASGSRSWRHHTLRLAAIADRHAVTQTRRHFHRKATRAFVRAGRNVPSCPLPSRPVVSVLPLAFLHFGFGEAYAGRICVSSPYLRLGALFSKNRSLELVAKEEDTKQTNERERERVWMGRVRWKYNNKRPGNG